MATTRVTAAAWNIFLLMLYFPRECVLTESNMTMAGTLSTANNSADDNHNSHISSNHTQRHRIHLAGLDFHAVSSPLVYTVIVLLAGLSKILYHYANFLSAKIPESCMLIVLGTIFGAIIHFSGAGDHLPMFFAPHDFFLFLLPPIILESAFSLHDRTFADNIGSVLLFAVVGTILACFMLGLTLYALAVSGAMGALPVPLSLVQILVFTSLIVAVDPVAVLAVFQEIGVNHVLYFLVFGESLLNDGVTVVLYKVMQTYNNMDSIPAEQIVLGMLKFFVVCFGGLFLGVLAGVGTAILTRFTTKIKVLQPLVIYTMAYLGFLLAELFEFSGIISIIGCGLTQVHYAFHNISYKSRTTVKYFTKVISSASEIVIFMFLGLALVRQNHVWHTGFTLWTIFFCLVYRFIIVFGMTFFINRLDRYRVRKIGFDEQFMIAYGGLRGAVCFSLVALLNEDEIPMKNMFVTSTLFVIMFTVFIQGISIKPLVRFFQVQLATEKSISMYCELNSQVSDHVMAGIEDIIGFHGRYHFREFFHQFENKYILRWLQKHPERSDSKIKEFYDKLVLKEHYRYLMLSGVTSLPSASNIPRIDTESYLASLDKTKLILPNDEEEVSSDSDKEVDFEPVTLRRRKKVDPNLDAKGLRQLLTSQLSSRLLLHSAYDRDLVSESRNSLLNNIQAKFKRRERLQHAMSMHDGTAERPRSWSDTNMKVCEERTATKKTLGGKSRAATVDLGNTSRQGVYLTSPDPEAPSPAALPPSQDSPLSPHTPLDAVFEEEETEGLPLIGESEKSRICEDSEKTRIHRESEIGSKHGKLKKQYAMDEIPLKSVKSLSDP
ncbi:Na(+)/H(+) exchanger beta-like [Gigantopelta aegis]|uniref:Na(+)/H(+) exchanger beta-like n=1 Tax=Gigantopelta aegis TaxID=1735272 RepID=UPI001B88B7C2|nr:Na(+)/H(+) exchanger beta-like [Gigantopelta aegis]